MTMNPCTIILIFILSSLSLSPPSTATTFFPGERDDLIQLRDSLTSTMNLHSIWTGPPCHNNQSRWFGISCSNSHVVSINLQSIQLTGTLQPNTLQSLSQLTNLSFTNNALHGELPTLEGLTQLQVVSFAGNRFSGPIPLPYATSLPSLSQLELQDNLLNGTIPDFKQKRLEVFNVSYNFLEGRIPTGIERFPRSSYEHNVELCGKPLEKLCPMAPAPSISISTPPISSRTRRASSLNATITVLVSLGAVVVPLMIILCFLWYYRRQCKTREERDESVEATTEHANKVTGTYEPDGTYELKFFDDKPLSFDMDDLLRASAEMMGKGKLGTTFRATLESGQVIVAKRLKEMSGLSKKEFFQQMRVLGSVRHENLVEILAFYDSKDERLVIYENVPGESLYQLLHDNRGVGRVPLNWTARLSIVKGITRGLAHLHYSLLSHKVPHANLKSSNVLVVQDHHHHPTTYHTKLTDFGFLPFLPSPQQARKLAIGKTPELSQDKKLSRKTDIYCFGLVLLEVITGQVPSDEDLSEWVRSAIRNDWTTDILDIEIVSETNGHEEMLMLTKIALECTSAEPNRRPGMSELVMRIEQMGEANNEEGTTSCRKF